MKCFALCLIGLLLQQTLSAQPRTYPDYRASSGFELDASAAADPQVLDNLETLCRVWGFVKYHHPAMRDTTVHIDYELFGLLPRIVGADKPERNRILSEWIASFGPVESDPSHYVLTPDSAYRRINSFDWIGDTVRLGGELSRRLQELRYAVRHDDNRYVYKLPNTVTLSLYDDSFPNYPPDVPFDAGYRLLCLFRFWNVIDSFSPNRNITDKPWDQVLTEYLPRMIADRDSYILTLMEIYAAVDDAHSAAHSMMLFGRKIAPIKATLIDDRLIVTESSPEHPLLPGDEVVEAVGRTLPEVVAKVVRYVPNSNKATVRREAAKLMFVSWRDTIPVTYLHDGERRTARVATYWPPKEIGKREAFRMLNDSTAYVFIGTFTKDCDFERIYDSIKHTKTLIVDMRGYPADHTVRWMFFAKYFVAKPSSPICTLDPLHNYPGIFSIVPSGDDFGKWVRLDVGKTITAFTTENPEAYPGRLILLVNEHTQSASEYITMLLQSIPGTITVGSQTAGADGDVVEIIMPLGLDLNYSSIGIYYPDGTNAQRAGVKIDRQVYPTVDGIRTGRDEVLEAALYSINGQ